MELNDKVRAFLEAPRFAVLATLNQNGTAQQSTMWFELQGDSIMMNTAAGRKKVANMERDPRVSLCIPDGYTYVTLRGRVELNPNREQGQQDIARLAVRYHGAEEAQKVIPSYREQHRISIRMTIEQVAAHGL
ncbi:MAG TPA: PPOX class F420-dependent oxidoreductase [Thermomicrobiaceae bacterium]|nr:PPOX class F420-dependent oxidoreductase [Thermomicrobiaceae bacterium]